METVKAVAVSSYPEFCPDWVKIGRNCNIDESVTFVESEEGDIVIGDNVTLASGVVLYSPCVLECKVRVWHNTVLRGGVRIGKHSNIGALSMLEGHLSIGEHCSFIAQSHFTDGLKIGNYTFFGTGVWTSNDNRMRYRRSGHHEGYNAPTIGDRVRVACGVGFLPGVKVGDDAVIGASSLVTRDVPEGAFVVGIPAKEKPMHEGFMHAEIDKCVECN